MAEFDRLGHPWVIFDPGDFPEKVQVQALICNDIRQSSFLLTNGTRIVLEEFTSVWYRRPTRILSRDTLPTMEQTFILREANAGIWGWLRGLQAFWINHPDDIRAAGLKRMPTIEGHRDGRIEELDILNAIDRKRDQP